MADAEGCFKKSRTVLHEESDDVPDPNTLPRQPPGHRLDALHEREIRYMLIVVDDRSALGRATGMITDETRKIDHRAIPLFRIDYLPGLGGGLARGERSQ